VSLVGGDPGVPMSHNSRSILVADERERALGVQAGLISVANEVVVLVMVGGAGSMVARGLRRSARRRGRGQHRRIRVNLL
jgi:hypothetical protein